MKETVASSIEAENLAKRFGSVAALADVSFDVKAGEMFFLLGPSGCGKTTLLRILAGLETADSGTVLINGRDVRDLPAHERGLPMVFQNYALWPHLTVLENVAFGLRERRVPRDEAVRRAREALEKVDLAGREDRKPGQLSGGQQQREAHARDLVLNPAAVLLDEPLSNLDAKLRVEMREYLARLHASSGITFVYVTHDQVEALSLADRMAVMSAGRIMAVGSPAALYHRPPNAFCAGFLGEANIFPARAVGRDGQWLVVETHAGRWSAAPAEGFDPPSGAEVLLMVRPENVRPLSGSPAGVNVFKGRVVSARMNGSTVTVLVASGETTWKATVLSDPLAEWRVGRECGWMVDRAHAVAMPASEKEAAR